MNQIKSILIFVFTFCIYLISVESETLYVKDIMVHYSSGVPSFSLFDYVNPVTEKITRNLDFADVNKHLGGKYVFIEEVTTTDRNEALSGIELIITNDGNNPDYRGDITKGAGGTNRYFHIKKKEECNGKIAILSPLYFLRTKHEVTCFSKYGITGHI